MTVCNVDVAIIGAGPTGLTLANALGLRGLSCLLIERRAGTVREPRAVSIDDEALRTMQAIGLDREVVADCALDYGSHYFTAGGDRFAAVEPTTREFGFPRRNAFTQPRLEATLLKGLRRFSNVEIRFGTECEDIIEIADGVELRLRGPEGSRVVRATWLVGCDGARSATRKAIGAELTGSTYAQPWLIVDLATTHERLRQTRVVCDPTRPFITLPGPGGIRRYEFMLRPGEDEDAATEQDFVHGLLAAAGPDADTTIVRKQVYTFHARVADRWRRGHVLIAGDAAHLSPPFAGQGMNSGIRDAQNLAWKLAAVTRGEFGEALLDTYQREREPHARALIDLAIRMGRVMMPTSPAQARLVQAGFRMLRFAPRLKDYVVQMKYKPKPFYRTGFRVGAGAPVGYMFPQPIVERADGSRERLDDLLGPGFALITYGPDAQDILAQVAGQFESHNFSAAVAILPRHLNADSAHPKSADTVRDFDSGLSGFLSADTTSCLVLRPDRHVCVILRQNEIGRLPTEVTGLFGEYRQLEASSKKPRDTTGEDRSWVVQMA